MTPQSPQTAPAKVIVFWVIWAAILMGLVVIQMFIGGGIPFGVDKGNAPLPFVGIAAGAAFASLVVRFVVQPMAKTLEQKLRTMVIGLALAEACGIVGAVLIPHDFPQTRLWLFVAALVCAALQAPVYVRENAGSDGYTRRGGR